MVGFIANTMRVIPKELDLEIDYSAIKTPEVFSWVQKNGNVQTNEMFKVFNMGIGMVIVADSSAAEEILAMHKGSYVFGEVK